MTMHAMTTERKTAIIVNDRGESFIGWGNRSPIFAKPILAKTGNFRPFGTNDGDWYWIHPPYQYESAESAAKAMVKMSRKTIRKLAVICPELSTEPEPLHDGFDDARRRLWLAGVPIPSVDVLRQLEQAGNAMQADPIDALIALHHGASP